MGAEHAQRDPAVRSALHADGRDRHQVHLPGPLPRRFPAALHAFPRPHPPPPIPPRPASSGACAIPPPPLIPPCWVSSGQRFGSAGTPRALLVVMLVGWSGRRCGTRRGRRWCRCSSRGRQARARPRSPPTSPSRRSSPTSSSSRQRTWSTRASQRAPSSSPRSPAPSSLHHCLPAWPCQAAGSCLDRVLGVFARSHVA